MAGKFFVVQGAICTCQYGTAPDQLEISSNEKDYINDSNGSMKPIGSTKDIGQPFKAKTFGYCSKIRSSCSMNVTEWQNFYEKVTLANNGKILTEESKATCALGAPSCIKFEFHGQTAAVSPEQAAASDANAMATLNPMAPKPLADKKEMPKVKQIKVTLPARAQDKTKNSKKKEEKNIIAFVARVNEDMLFEVTEYWNKAKADTGKVSWKIIKAHAWEGESETLTEIGPALSISFDAPGAYRVLAFGNESGQNDDMCCFNITVKHNALKEEIGFDAAFARVLPGGREYRLRRGVACTLKTAYEMEPTAEERRRVHMQVSDKQGNIIKITGKGEDTVTFTPENTAAVYTVTAAMLTPEGAEQQVHKTFHTEANSVAEVTCAQGEQVRVNTDMTFQAKMRYDSLSLESFEKAAIKWQLDGRDVGTGPTLTLQGSTYFFRPGRHVVEAYVVSANAWSVNSKGKQIGVNEKDDWRFEVKFNEVLEVTGPTKWVVGKKYDFEAKLSFGTYDKAKDGNIVWKTPGGTGTFSGTSCKGAFAAQVMNSSVVATLGNSSKELKISAGMAAIERWCFTDTADVYKGKAGWNEKVTAVVRSAAAAGEKVHLHLFEGDKGKDFNYIKDLGEATFDKDGIAKVEVNTNDIRAELEKLYFEGDYYDVFFAMEKGQGLLFAGVKEFKSKEKTFLFPSSSSNQSGAEVGKYIYIDGTPNIVDVRYLDAGGNRIYKVLNYGEKARMHVQTMNLAGQKVKMSIYLNIARGEDVLIMSDKEFTVLKDETILIDIDTNVLKKHIAEAERKKIAMFYVVLKEADGDKYMYPDDLSLSQTLDTKKVNFYHHLKLSESTEHINKLARDNAPAVLGEPLEGAGSSNCGGKYCIKKGDKNELVREINIRLAGFGGNVPTDEFTDRTERMIKQFQRDYMKVPETGKICGNVLKAIDEFTTRYTFKFDEIKCRCGTKGKTTKDILLNKDVTNNCSGFGDNSNKGVYVKGGNSERHHAYEYPGLHRSLLFALKAVIFYIDKVNPKYKFDSISSGFRCRFHSIFIGSQTTNHMGKALDVLFDYEKGGRAQQRKDLDTIRKDYFEKYLGATYWTENARKEKCFGLETHEQGAKTWVHFDVREFESQHLEDKFFCKTETQLKGKSIVQLAMESGYQNTCFCIEPYTSQKNGGTGSGSCEDKFKKVAPIILKHEGGYVNDPDDSGGETNKGITIGTWKSYAKEDLGVEPTSENLKKITDEQATIIYRKRYWEPKGFCKINDDKVSLMIYDWTITSGGAGKEVQKLLVNEFGQHIETDGDIGTATIDAINNVEDQDKLLKRIGEIRKQYYTDLAYYTDKEGKQQPSKNHKFLNGWHNRVDDCLNVKL